MNRDTLTDCEAYEINLERHLAGTFDEGELLVHERGCPRCQAYRRAAVATLQALRTTAQTTAGRAPSPEAASSRRSQVLLMLLSMPLWVGGFFLMVPVGQRVPAFSVMAVTTVGALWAYYRQERAERQRVSALASSPAEFLLAHRMDVDRRLREHSAAFKASLVMVLAGAIVTPMIGGVTLVVLTVSAALVAVFSQWHLVKSLKRQLADLGGTHG